MDTAATQAAWRREQLSYTLPIRTVYDREIGTFSHDTDSLRDNSFATTLLPSGFEVGLVSKARNYSTTEFDVLQTMLDDGQSSIHEMDRLAVRDFFSLTADIYENMSRMSGHSIAVGLNQHPEGFRISERDGFGNKQRVQTLEPLHVHVYEVSVATGDQVAMSDLPIDDQRDMSDPFLSLSLPILMNRLRSDPHFEGLVITAGDPLTPPWGLNIMIEKPLSEFLREQSEILVELQRILFVEYERWSSAIRTANRAGILEMSNSLPDLIGRRLQLLASSLRPEEDVESQYLFTKGGAVTYTLFEDDLGHAVLSVHPRLMSKGNSADAMGIYVDNFEGERVHELEGKKMFYQRLIAEMAVKRGMEKGTFLTKGDS